MSAQAVGGAIGHNSISLIIPCHCVAGTNGSLTGYAGGIDKLPTKVYSRFHIKLIFVNVFLFLFYHDFIYYLITEIHHNFLLV